MATITYSSIVVPRPPTCAASGATLRYIKVFRLKRKLHLVRACDERRFLASWQLFAICKIRFVCIVYQQTSTMAFMMPVMKNDWDIYKSNRSRRTSECSNANSCRSRKVSECRSEGPSSMSTSPGSDFRTSPHQSVPDKMSSRQYTRSNSASYPRTSAHSLQSPMKSTSSSPPKNISTTSLNKFHNRLLDKLKKTMKSGKDDERTSSWGKENGKFKGTVAP